MNSNVTIDMSILNKIRIYKSELLEYFDYRTNGRNDIQGFLTHVMTPDKLKEAGITKQRFLRVIKFSPRETKMIKEVLKDDFL